MTDQSAITAMAGDPKSRTLAVANSNGYVIIFEVDLQGEWKPLHSIAPKDEIPVTSVGLLTRSGDNLFAVAYANGQVKLISASGWVAAEINAHSRGINALTCHPTRAFFATSSDDTFVTLWEVSDDTLSKLDVNVVLTSKVNDY